MPLRTFWARRLRRMARFLPSICRPFMCGAIFVRCEQWAYLNWVLASWVWA